MLICINDRIKISKKLNDSLKPWRYDRLHIPVLKGKIDSYSLSGGYENITFTSSSV